MREPLNRMMPDEIAERMSSMQADRSTVAEASTEAFDIRSYLQAVNKICAILLRPGELLGVSLALTKQAAISVSLRLPGGEDNTFRFYSAQPAFRTDILALFTNLQSWTKEAEGVSGAEPMCPLPDHTDTWDLALMPERGETMHGDLGVLWRVCSTTRQKIDIFG